MEEAILNESSELVNKRLNESRIKQITDGALVLAIRKAKTGSLMLNPQGSTLLEVGHVLIALGTEAQLNILQKLAL